MAKEVAPTCKVTELPLPILPPGPRENGAHLFPNLPYFPDNNHHAWYNENWLKKQGLGGAALQASRIQNIDWYYHKNYHDMFKRGPKTPRGEDELFRLGVLSVAGVIPQKAVDVSKRGEFALIEISEDQRAWIASKTTIDQKKPVARFLTDYVAKQEITEVVDEIKVEEFLDRRTDYATKIEIARLMLGEAIELSLDNLGLYQQEKELKEQGLFAQPKPRTFYWTARHLIRLNHLGYFIDSIEDRLVTT